MLWLIRCGGIKRGKIQNSLHLNEVLCRCLVRERDCLPAQHSYFIRSSISRAKHFARSCHRPAQVDIELFMSNISKSQSKSTLIGPKWSHVCARRSIYACLTNFVCMFFFFSLFIFCQFFFFFFLCPFCI